MSMPKHVSVILDGNRRYALKKKKGVLSGHIEGVRRVEELIDWCKEFKIKELSLYSFSSENIGRTKKEVDFLMNLFRKQISRLNTDPKFCEDKETVIRFIGDKSVFPSDIEQDMKKVENKTKENKKIIVNFLMGYGGRQEIIEAVKSISAKVKKNKIKIEDIDEMLIRENLMLASYPDLLIRTSETRISNFLLWQLAYSEMIFLPNKLWPEFSKEDFRWCLKEYSKRKRRYGR